MSDMSEWHIGQAGYEPGCGVEGCQDCEWVPIPEVATRRRDAIRDCMLADALHHGNSVEHATDLAVALVDVYDAAFSVAGNIQLMITTNPRMAGLGELSTALRRHAELVDRLRPDRGKEHA